MSEPIHPHVLTDPSIVKTFILGGKARFTMRSKATGNRFTYKVKPSKDKTVFFVLLMTGSDNVHGYDFLGTIFADRTYQHSHKSVIGPDYMGAKAFTWLWDHLRANRLSDAMEFWHEGRCGRCRRPLTDPESIKTGFGPECIHKVQR